MVQYSQDCSLFGEANEPLINYLDVSAVAAVAARSPLKERCAA